MNFSENILNINSFLEQFTSTLPNNSLYDPVKYILKNGGKRIRPICTLITANAIKKNKYSLPIASAIEVFHNFTLVHDDIMDNSSQRRGNETIHKKWDINKAILSGDAMLILVYKILSEIDDEKIKLEVISELSHIALGVCEGQENDMNFEKVKRVSVDDYLLMIKQKTAILLGFSFKAGAISAKADSETQSICYQIGENLGIAFQLQDDLLDCFGNEKFGKPIGQDILNCKKNLLYVITLDQLPKQNKMEFIETYHKNFNTKVNDVNQLYIDKNIKVQAEEMIKHYFHKTQSLIKELNQRNIDVSEINGVYNLLKNRAV